MRTFTHEQLGCKVNQYDAERARRHLLDLGYVESDAPASLVLLASCTVTGRAAAKGRHRLRSLLRRNPEAQLAVMGCMTEADRTYYASLGSRVTFLPSARTDDFLAALDPVLRRIPERPAASPAIPRPTRTRAFLKVEDGCDLHCTFCIIPSVRGRARSRSSAEILAEMQGLLDRGVREVVLTGVHLGHYGRRSPDTLSGLLRVLCELPGEFRLRLSSLEVSELSSELLGVIASGRRIVPHLHLPLQSGSEAVLRAMRRPYTARLFRQKVAELRQRLDDPALSTDVIVGFPGETDRDFEATLELCEEAQFAKIHVFPFSSRAGTPAAERDDLLPPPLQRERRDRLLQLADRLRTDSHRRRVGRSAEVLIEDHSIDLAEGYDERYHRVVIRAPGRAKGELEAVQIVGTAEGKLLAELV